MMLVTSLWVNPDAPPTGPTRSPSGGRPPASGPTTNVPVAVPGPTPLGAVVWFTKGKAMPPIITTPGGGSCAAVGRKPACEAPEKAANSAIAADELTTPTPPTAAPFLNSGTPPGFTAAGLLSSASALPVITPKPGLSPSIERAGSMLCPARKLAFRKQPRLVFSIPYRSALGAFETPGGK